MRIVVRLVSQPVVLIAVLTCLVGCGAEKPAQSSDSVDGEATSERTWDPIAIEEPEIAPPPKGRPTEQQLLRFLDHVGAAYTYSLRTGFLQSLLAVIPDSCACRFMEEVSELADAGLHAEMDEISMRVLESGSVEPLREGTWSLTVLVEMSIPERVIADESGREVRVEPAETRRADVVLLSDLGQWFMYDWSEMDSPEGSA